MKTYRCLVGHLICESLGYFTPRAALHAILAHRDGKPFGCEWYSHIATVRGKGVFDEETLCTVNRDVIDHAFRSRHDHTGPMNAYGRAKALVVVIGDSRDDPNPVTLSTNALVQQIRMMAIKANASTEKKSGHVETAVRISKPAS